MTQPSYSSSMVTALERFFEDKYYGRPTCVGHRNTDIRFNNHNFNPVFLRVSSNQSGIYEIPSLTKAGPMLTDIMQKNIGEGVTPLSVIDSQMKGTADSIFKYFFSYGRHNYPDYLGLRKATTRKGEVYYGASGLILDSSFEPIIIGLSEYTMGNNAYLLYRNVLKVSPKVFISEGLLEKAIIKKLIPFYTRNSVGGKTVRVEVDDISKYIIKPVSPKAGVQETLKNIMSTYKDEILKDIIP